jgi:hypothetical protein
VSLDDRLQRVTAASALRRHTSHGTDDGSDSEHDRPVYMNRLGDGAGVEDDLDRAEKEDRSIQGSVY